MERLRWTGPWLELPNGTKFCGSCKRMWMRRRRRKNQHYFQSYYTCRQCKQGFVLSRMTVAEIRAAKRYMQSTGVNRQ